jgi:hypothetical protein
VRKPEAANFVAEDDLEVIVTKIDIFPHILPKPYCDKMLSMGDNITVCLSRQENARKCCDSTKLETREVKLV